MATVPASRVLPPALKANGLRNLPAIVHGDIAIDTVEEIIDHIEVYIYIGTVTHWDFLCSDRSNLNLIRW